MKRLTKILVIGLLSLGIAGMSFASGFAIYEHSARAMGQANAFVARADEASAVWFNPAGMTQLEGTHILIGATGIAHQSTYFSDTFGLNVSTDNALDIPPFFFITTQLSKNIWFGLGVNVPFGLAQNWGSPTATNPVPYHTGYASLHMIHISPAIAIKISPKFSIGAGIHYVMASVELERYMDVDGLVGIMTGGLVTDVEDVHFSAEVSNEVVTFYGGFQWDITPDITFGAVYHSGTDVDFEGDVTFDQPVTGIAAVDLILTALFPEMTGSTALPIVDQIMVGLAFKAGDKLDLEIDVNFAMWSQYESLDLTFETETSFFGTPIVANASAPKNWEDTMCVRFGGEYHASEKMDIRFGVLYDTNPVPDETLDPMLPDNDRFGLSAGFGYKANGFVIDFAYMLLLQAERSSTNDILAPLDQNYEAGQSHLFSLSLGLIL